MAASLKMFQICRTCLKCLNSKCIISTGSLKKPVYEHKIRGLSTSSCLLKNKKSNNNNDDTKSGKSVDEEVDESLELAAKNLTDKMPEKKREDVTLDLMKKLRSMSVKKQDGQLLNKKHLGSVLNKMRTIQVTDIPKSEKFKGIPQVQGEDRGRKKRLPSRTAQRTSAQNQGKDYKLFEGPRLGIFELEDMENSVKKTKETLWDVYEREQLDQLKASIPRNGFEEMMLWTKQGKMWQFPIDNEQGWEQEHNTPFHEHIFLDSLIEDFPKQGPLRHFMELVIIGLSKNPGLSAQQKREHIQWFREYFIEKQDILKQTLGDNGVIGQAQAQIEMKNV